MSLCWYSGDVMGGLSRQALLEHTWKMAPGGWVRGPSRPQSWDVKLRTWVPTVL